MNRIINYLLASVLLALTIPLTTQAADGLIAHWTFDKDTKQEVKDSSGKNHGLASNVRYSQGVIGKAAEFDGKKSKIIISSPKGTPPTAITSLTLGTVSFWVKFENRGGQMLPILHLGKSSTSMPSRSMIFEIGHDRGNIDNRRLYFTSIIAQQQNFCVDSGFNLTPGVWYHYVAVMGESGSTLYINGVEITTRRYNLGSTRQSSTFFNDIPNKELLSIGYGRYSQEEPFFSFNGLIDDMRIYNRPLNKEEVLELFNLAGLKMGDAQLGFIDAAAMEGKEPLERSSRGKQRGERGERGERSSSQNRTNNGSYSQDRSNNYYDRTSTRSNSYR